MELGAMKSWDEIRKATATFSKRWTNATDSVSLMREWLYNNRSELAAASIGTNLFGCSYDTIGNRLWSADNMITNCYAANSLNQYTTVGRAVPSAPPTTFTYTSDGGLSSDGTWSYAYDAEDQLRSVTSRSLTNGAIRVRNTYDYRRRRISKTVQRLNVTTASPPAPPVELREWETCEERTFVYDDWNLIHETIYTIEGGVTNMSEVQYFWGLDLSDTLQGAGGVGGLLAVSRNGQFYFPSFDNNGNITKYIDESGTIVATHEYDDFGRIISQSGPLADFFRHCFSTKYYDPETCLLYYGFRFYAPVWLVFPSRDFIEEKECVNLYNFCRNNTLNAVDHLGRNRYMTTFSLDPNKDQWYVGVAVDTWACQNGKWRKTGVATFDYGVDDSKWWYRAGTFVAVAKGMLTENPGLTLVEPLTIASSPHEELYIDR